MFVEKLLENNRRLLLAAKKLHKDKEILPDTYVLDLDTITENGRKMVETAKPLGVKLFFMLKQIGRNPLVAKELMNVGFDGCVAVDYKEALLMIDNGIHLGNVGHLVQVPAAAMNRIVASKPDYITVYSYDIIDEIEEAGRRNNVVQKVLIRITDEDAELYSGQIAGFNSKELKKIVEYLNTKEYVEFGGITAFPAFLYDSKKNEIVRTVNVNGVDRAKEILKSMGIEHYMINLPSASCCASIPSIKEVGGELCSGEPGHGLTGTTPLHVHTDGPEKVGYCYVSEVCHSFNGKSYCYGGGHYRRGHMANCLVGENMEKVKVAAPDDDSIDYHYELDKEFRKGEVCLMAYRTQFFTTRSQVAVVKGIQSDKPELVGLYTALGKKEERNW